MPGMMPAVEIAMWRMPSSRIFGSLSILTARRTSSVLRNGSPIPMNTTLFISRPASISIAMNCPAISPPVRLRSNPDSPVWQNGQPIGHPACVERQAVNRPDCLRSAVSTFLPSRISSRNFFVPSGDFSVFTILGNENSITASRSSLSDLLKSLISWTFQTRLFQSHAQICVAR